MDAPNFSRYLVAPDIRPVEYESIEPPTITDDSRRLAVELALASERVTGKLDGKRFEILNVGTYSADRETHHPLVVIYNYTDDVVLECTIDSLHRTVLEVNERRDQPALAAAEQSQALEIVRDDGRLADAGVDIATGLGLIVEDHLVPQGAL